MDNRTAIPNVTPGLIRPDTRTRQEKKEDREKELAAVDYERIEATRGLIRQLHSFEGIDPEDLEKLKSELDSTLTKFLHLHDQYLEINSVESRKIELRREELNLEARADWKMRLRAFTFKVFGTFLLICSLFLIGHIESEYEWAKLPMTKYLNTSTKLP